MIVKYTCSCCGKVHGVPVDGTKLTKAQKNGTAPVGPFFCPTTAYRYLLRNHCLDMRVRWLKDDMLKQNKESLYAALKLFWGELNINDKINRFIDLDFSFLGVSEEYYKFIREIVDSYSCGYFYVSMTSAGALGERILNRLLIRTREYFKSSEHYKKIYRKDSFDDWSVMIKILKDWGVISSSVADLFVKLKKYRNDSIHYNSEYPFEKNAKKALKLLCDIIEKQFDYGNRTDLLWVYNVPGEIIVRKDKEDDPFVKAFILPNCTKITAFSDLSSKKPPQNVPQEPLSDEEFIKLRQNSVMS